MNLPEDDQLDAAIPEADRIEQGRHVDSADGPDGQWPGPAIPEADEADWLEQAEEVPAEADEEYPSVPPGY